LRKKIEEKEKADMHCKDTMSRQTEQNKIELKSFRPLHMD